MNDIKLKIRFSRESYKHFNNHKRGIHQWCMNFYEETGNLTVLIFRSHQELNLFKNEYNKNYPNEFKNLSN